MGWSINNGDAEIGWIGAVNNADGGNSVGGNVASKDDDVVADDVGDVTIAACCLIGGITGCAVMGCILTAVALLNNTPFSICDPIVALIIYSSSVCLMIS